MQPYRFKSEINNYVANVIFLHITQPKLNSKEQFFLIEIGLGQSVRSQISGASLLYFIDSIYRVRYNEILPIVNMIKISCCNLIITLLIACEQEWELSLLLYSDSS